jgi:hypothetical protein
VTIDPLAVALPTILTILLCVKFWVSDSENTRSKLTAFALLVGLVWILPFLYENRRVGLVRLMREPIPNTFIQMHPVIVIFVVMIAWGIYIYFVSTND